MKLLLSFLLPALVISQGLVSTPAPLDRCLWNYNNNFCGTNRDLIVVDASSYTIGNGLIDQQYQLLLNKFIPIWQITTEQYVVAYGDGSTLFPSALTDHQDACQVTQAEYDYDLQHAGQHVLVSDTMRSLYSRYSSLLEIAIFSATTNYSDAMQTQFPAQGSGSNKSPIYAVVDWSGAQMWRNRAYSGDIDLLIEVNPNSDMDQIAGCLSYFTCNMPDYYLACSAIAGTSSAAPSTAQPSTKAPGPIRTAEPQCECDYKKVWVDIMLVFDSSYNVAPNQTIFVELVAQVKSGLYQLNIETKQSVTQQNTRIGMISYGNEATLVTTLGSQNGDQFEKQEVPYSGDPKTNIDDALSMAMVQLNSNAHRPNAKKVIILVTNTFVNGDASPTSRAATFKNQSGTIVIYNPVVFAKTPQNMNILEQIVSSGYNIYENDDQDPEHPALANAMCDVNCFCPSGYDSPYFDGNRGYPIGGCNTLAIKTANEPLAQYNCQLQNNGNLTTSKYREKSVYLESIIGTGNIFWIGLTYDKFSDWYFWGDGTPLDNSTNWPVWGNQQGASTNGCVYEKSMTWYHTVCTPTYKYLCEGAPCSSTLYCQ